MEVLDVAFLGGPGQPVTAAGEDLHVVHDAQLYKLAEVAP
jgi:hypothetical protein